MPERTRTVSLLPNTGVQYIELPALFSEKEIKDAKNKWHFDVKSAVTPRIRLSRGRAVGDGAGRGEGEAEPDPASSFSTFSAEPAPAIDAGGKESTGADSAAVVADPEIVLEIARAGGGWVPVPFNTTSALWAMIWLSPSTTAPEFYDAVLAIDTTTTPHGEDGTLPESSIPGTFHLEPVRLGVFWSAEPLGAWIERHYQRRLKLQSPPPAGRDPREWRGALQAHLAGFYLFLKEREGFPDIQFEPELVSTPIDISLVVDLGNSRTCCVIHEMRKAQGRKPFYALELRDPRRPMQVWTEPAHTRLAFVPPGKGPLPGAKTFMDLSIVRYGRMAVDLLGEAGGDVGARGLSSPKRYMWDNEKRSEPWQLALPDPAHPRNTIYGPLLRRMDESRPFSEPDLTDTEPVNPSYPRKAGAMFLLIEILEQAFRQANSPTHRGVEMLQAGYRSRRAIRSLVLMHPAGMHSEEVKQLKMAAERAAFLFAQFRQNPVAFVNGHPETPNERNGFPVPQVIQECDEGMSIQICYLYGETMHRYAQRTDRLVKAMGRLRGGQQSVRIASIDIGGGTTDLAIADYNVPIGAVQGTFRYRRLFHDGFPVGGDDLSQDILHDRIFPNIIAQMGLAVPQWNALFSVATAVDPAWGAARRNLVTALWVPLVHGCLRRIEAGQRVEATVGELVTVRNVNAARELDNRLKKIALPTAKGQAETAAVKSIFDVRVTISQEDAVRVARRSLGTALRQYCDIIGQYRADVLVLGGRPSSLPAVAQLVRESLPLPPGAVVFLHEQRVDDWFPFNENGRIGDSKTCSVIGAALAFMARHDYSNFILRLDRDAQPVVNIQGVLSVGEMVLDQRLRLFPAEADISDPIPFEGEAITIGCRHIDGDSAMARPTYRLIRDPWIQGRIRAVAVYNDPLLVRVSREGVGSDVLKVSDVQGDAKFYNEKTELVTVTNDKNTVRCKLQTLIESDYWLDSGCFRELGEE